MSISYALFWGTFVDCIPQSSVQSSAIIFKLFRILVWENKMTISELGSLGEVIGAFGLIVTLIFLAMGMRLKRQSEDNRDLEQVQIRV